MAGGLSLVIDRLACPICRSPVTFDGRAVACPTGHRFDVARQGYVSLLGGGARAKTGDTAAMVASRQRFLATGDYLPIARAVSGAVGSSATGLCVDLAGGTGYYLAVVLDDHAALVGLDVELSGPALRRAARTHERLAAVAADVWQPLPIRSATAARVLSIFGPRNAPEIARVLDADGRLITVTPTDRHLRELVGALGLVSVDPHKQARLDEQLQGFARVGQHMVEYAVAMSGQDVLDVALMGPSAHHVEVDALTSQLESLAETMSVTVSVHVTTWCVDGAGARRH